MMVGHLWVGDWGADWYSLTYQMDITAPAVY